MNKKEIINDIKKYGLLPEWLKNESQKYIDTELNMSDFIQEDNGVILVKPPIGWTWAIQKNY